MFYFRLSLGLCAYMITLFSVFYLIQAIYSVNRRILLSYYDSALLIFLKIRVSQPKVLRHKNLAQFLYMSLRRTHYAVEIIGGN